LGAESGESLVGASVPIPWAWSR